MQNLKFLLFYNSCFTTFRTFNICNLACFFNRENLIVDIEKLGKQLDTTQSTYHDALNKLNKGKGNLVNQAQQLLDLGVKVKKEIPKSMLENTDLDSE